MALRLETRPRRGLIVNLMNDMWIITQDFTQESLHQHLISKGCRVRRPTRERGFKPLFSAFYLSFRVDSLTWQRIEVKGTIPSSTIINSKVKYMYLTLHRLHPVLDPCAKVRSFLPFGKMENCTFCQRRST